MAALVSYAVSGTRGARILPQLERGGGGDGRCDAEEPMGRYAAYTERTITVEKELAIALGDGAAYRRLRRRLGRVDDEQRSRSFPATPS